MIVDGERRDLGDGATCSAHKTSSHDALPALIDAGVHSLKIEGRYKGPAYVATVVDSWRNWRDALVNGGVRGATDEDRERLARDVERTQLTFSRGGSPGFLQGDDHQSLVVGTTPKHRGLPLGEVSELRGRSLRVRVAEGSLPTTLRAGMGVMFELADRRGRNVP